MKSIFTKRQFFHCALVLLLAFNMASHSPPLWPGNDWYGRVIYWATRFGIESVLFIGCYYLLSLSVLKNSNLLALILAFLISWPIFVLTITMLDIVLGHPELDGALHGDRYHLIKEILDESYWIFPKHLFFCLLVTLINFRIDYSQIFNFRLDLFNKNNKLITSSNIDSAHATDRLTAKLSPGLREKPLRIQAQEHYVKVTTCLGSELIHYKFGEAMKDLNSEMGLQVHRSYWVAKNNIKGWLQKKNNIELQLEFGDPVPVSRRFEQIVKNEFLQI